MELIEARRGAPGLLVAWVALAVTVLVAGYALFAESLGYVVVSFQKPEFSHGYIIPLISGWIVWQRRHLIWARRGPGAWTGWLLVAAGVGFAFVCHAAQLLTPPAVGLLPVLVGLPATVLGWASARLLIVPVAFLMFAYPLPDYLYIELSTTLQLISSRIGAGLLDTFGVPVFLDGNIIDLGAMKLQVAEACSGLRYLLPLLSFGVLCAYMYRAPLWAKLVVVATTLPLTIALNGLRIAVTGLFVHFGSQSLAEGFMHLFEGWVVFLLALAILFGLMFALRRLLLDRRATLLDMLDFDRMAGVPDGRTEAVEPPAGTAVLPATPPRPFWASAGTLAVAALLLIPLATRPQVIPERPPLLAYPMTLDGRTAEPSFLDTATADTLGADDYLLLDFHAGDDAPPVNLWVAYYDALLHGPYIHSPTTCLPGAGWEYVELSPRPTELVDFSGRPLVVNRGVIVKGEQRIVIYFWMELRGRAVHDLQYVKLFNLRDSLLTGRSDGALVRLYTPLRPDEVPADADARLADFLESAYPHLQPHVGA
jgi:exosortase D (VPLPA-CTERM-specific)